MRRWTLPTAIFAAFVLIPFLSLRGQTTKPANAAAGGGQNVIAVFTLRGELSETPADELASLFGGSGTSLRELVARMKQSASDDSVKAVVLLDEGGTLGIAQIEELRATMKMIRDAGKEVYVNADSMMMGKYILFAGASRISVVPTADVWLTGLESEQPYLRGLLDKIGVTPDYLTCGAYKSAAEIFMRTGPSKEADEMLNWLLDGIYSDCINLIASGRNVSTEQAKQWIDNGPYWAEKAKQAGIVDAVETREQFQQMLKDKYGSDVRFEKKYGEKKQPQLDVSSPFAIFKLWADMLNASAAKRGGGKDAVGVVYVVGPIMVGEKEASIFGAANTATSSDIRKALDDAANDDSIKAVVLRIDSPGGSATASEIILNGTLRVKAKKPLVVSMGNVAGSGGYYVACGSDTIFADPSTLTGSIGVVGGKFATTPMWNKIGITWKSYPRGKNASLLSSDSTFTPEQRQVMQNWMDQIYGVFKNHVTTIRGDRLKKPIDDIAGGRVYTGRQALDLGLVDQLGTLQDAIAYAAKKASITDYDVRVVPEPKNFVEELVNELSGKGEKEDSKRLLRMSTGTQLWDLAAPYLSGVDPQRVAMIRQAFVQLQMLQSDGVVLMTPPVMIGQ